MPVELRAEDLKTFVGRIFIEMGAPPEDAPTMADAYVTADLYGLSSHGVMRVLRIQDGIDAGTHLPRNRPTIVRESEGTASIDGNSALGVAVGVFAMRLAIEKARSV